MLDGRRRIVITGIGALTPLGNDAESSWETLTAGKSGAGPITHFDASEYPVHFACELKEFDPTQWIERKQSRRTDRCVGRDRNRRPAGLPGLLRHPARARA